MCYVKGKLDDALIKEEFPSLAHAIAAIKEWAIKGQKIRDMKVYTISTILKPKKPYKVIDQN